MVLRSFDESVLWSKELMNSRHFFSLLLRIDIWMRLFSSSIFGECGSQALSSSLSVIHSLASSESWGITSLRLTDGMWCFDAVFMTFRSTASPWYTSVGPGWFLSALSISSWKAGQSDLAMLMKVRLGARMGSRNDEGEMDMRIGRWSDLRPISIDQSVEVSNDFVTKKISGDVCCWFEGRRVGQFSFRIPISDSSISAESLLPRVSAIVENQVGSWALASPSSRALLCQSRLLRVSW